MRLLKRSPNEGLELVSFDDDEAPPYAILSHTWAANQEVTYNEFVAGAGRDKTGYAKILFCARQAAADDLDYFWVDTCCIDKSNNNELTTAINSMFRWYQCASKCYVYLSDVLMSEEAADASWIEAFRQSRWFTRGWTLQELLAPTSVEFFSSNSKRLGSGTSLEQEIHKITSIPVQALREQPLIKFSVEERMSWAANRTTTLKEDKVYCLLGIFEIFLPLIYGEGEAHATVRLREEIEKREKRWRKDGLVNLSGTRNRDLQMDPSLTPLTPSSNVPFRRDSDYVERGDILAHVDKRCSRPAGRAALVGFGGFGGFGKSQLAIEYAHRVRRSSPNTWIFWVHASNPARVEEALSDIAERVGLSSQPDAAVKVPPLVRKWLCNEANGRWLMIVDNANDEIMIESQKDDQSISLASWLPQSDHGAILITSRNADVARSLVDRQQDIITVGAMSEGESVELLQNKLGKRPEDGATQLVQSLDCIPLAIVQAAAYINRLGPRMSVSRYLGELTGATEKVQLLQKAASDARRDEKALNSTLATWQISFEHIRQKRPSAASLLSFMSFFNRQGIPEFMVRHYTDKIDEKEEVDNLLDTQLKEEADFEEDMAVLRAFSLVGTTEREDEFEMHGLVQLATRIWLRSTEAEGKWRRDFIYAMAQEFPKGEFASWARCQILYPHVLPTVEQGDASIKKMEKWALLLHNAGNYACQRGLFAQAEGMVLKALEIRRDVLNTDDPDTLNSSRLLGSIWINLGKYEEAEQIHRQTLAMCTKVLGAEHSDTLGNMNNLARILGRRGKFKEAEQMHRQTLAKREKILGAEHPDALTTMNNLAVVLDHQGKCKEAEQIYRQTLAKREKILGAEHPEALTTMNNLAVVLNHQAKYDEAEQMYRQTLVTHKKVLGAEHPDTLSIMNNLALVLKNQKKYKEAEQMNKQILATCEKELGPEHPITLTSMNNLALIRSRQGKYKEAEQLHRQTLAMREKVLGAEHPGTLASVYHLAYSLASQHRYHESIKLYERACAGYNTSLGTEHPTTRACHQNYLHTLSSQGKH